MTIRAVLFDYGGTLDGAASHWLDRFVGLYREAGLDLPFERVRMAFYRADEAAYAEPRIARTSLREMMDFHVGVQLAHLGIGDVRLHEDIVARFVERSEAALACSRAVLNRLARRFSLGVVSNFYGNVDRVLTDAQIRPLLAVVADSGVVGFSKPDARIFRHAVAAIGTRPEETLHVGDSYERDVCAAHAAGLRAAWLVGNGQAPRDPADCIEDVRLQSLDELAACLESGEPPGWSGRL